MNAKEEFIQIYKENIHREGADAFLEFLEGPHSDFFTAPASTRFHGNIKGGLCAHSVHVYHCLKDYLDRQRVKEIYKMSYSDETIALVALLHDVCKINVYKKGTRNKKSMCSGNKWMYLNLMIISHLVMAKKVFI
ncbi:hypothetical protein [Holdemanella biformis]